MERKAEGEYNVTGDLTIHGVTKPVTFAVEGPSAPGKDPWGNTRIGLSATTKINRKDFGLVWNAALETGGFLVGDEIAITLDVQFIKSRVTATCDHGQALSAQRPADGSPRREPETQGHSRTSAP